MAHEVMTHEVVVKLLSGDLLSIEIKFDDPNDQSDSTKIKNKVKHKLQQNFFQSYPLCSIELFDSDSLNENYCVFIHDSLDIGFIHKKSNIIDNSGHKFSKYDIIIANIECSEILGTIYFCENRFCDAYILEQDVNVIWSANEVQENRPTEIIRMPTKYKSIENILKSYGLSHWTYANQKCLLS